MKRIPHVGSESVIALAELLKLKENGQFPGESVKIEGAQIRIVVVRRTRNNCHKGDIMRGMIIIISVVLAYFVSGSLI